MATSIFLSAPSPAAADLATDLLILPLTIDAPVDVEVPEFDSVNGQDELQGGGGGKITCTVKINNPHNSNHVPGAANVTGTTSCTAPVSNIAARIGLYRNRTLVAESGTQNFPGKSYAQVNAAETCKDGTYSGRMAVTVKFPPNYTPPSTTVYVSTKGFDLC